MQSLIRFFLKNHYAFLFLFLQGVSIALYIQTHYYQKASFINSANSVTGNLYQVVSNVENYFLLKKENELLIAENARLQELADYSVLKMEDDFRLINDTLYKQEFIYSNAEVVNADLHRKNNYLTINKGKTNGVKPDLAVIGPTGIVGVTKDVSTHFSTVVPIINSKYRLDVRIANTNQVGTISWRNEGGLDPNHAEILDIPITSGVEVGDTVVTSGYSKKYPKGLNVGEVVEVEKIPETTSLWVKVRLFTDYSKVNHVHVVQNLLREEWEELENQFE